MSIWNLFLKVSKSQKQIKVRDSSKKRTKHTQDSILSEFLSFFGRIKGIIDLLTFRNFFSRIWFFSSSLNCSSEVGLYKPWYDSKDSNETNERAKEAYEAVLTVTASYSSKSAEYRAFDNATRTLGSFNNYVDMILPFFDHLPTFISCHIVYGHVLPWTWTQIVIFGSTYPTYLVHVVIERPASQRKVWCWIWRPCQ